MRYTVLLLTLGLVLPVQAQLVLRKTEQTRQVLGEKGMEASTTLEVSTLNQKPLYTLKVEGVDGRTIDDELFVVARGLEDVEWWSVYRLADGKPLFDTHVPVVRVGKHYTGVYVPEDGDPRLKDGRLIGIASISTATGVVRHIELLCEDLKRAALLRSYWDARRTLTVNNNNNVLVFKIVGSVPDVTIRIPLEGADVVRCCDIVAR